MGDDELSVLAAALELIRRCDEANVLLNDLPPLTDGPAARIAWLKTQLSQTSVDILGEHYDLVKKTVVAHFHHAAR